MFLLDRSGSMNGAKIKLAAQAVSRFRHALPDDARVALVAFDSNPEVLLKPTAVSERASFDSALTKFRAHGGTDILPGRNLVSHGRRRHVVLLTDGQSNRHGILDTVKIMRGGGITLSAVAVGRGSDRRLLADMAEVGGGRHYFTDRPSNLPEFFKREARIVPEGLPFRDG